MTLRIAIASIITTLFLFPNNYLLAQGGELIEFINPSFEGPPQASRTPTGWYDCGREMFPDESAPDTQPGFFDVSKKAQHGGTFLGLVVRDNETWEAVSQRLPQPITQGNCYEFSLYLSKSEKYLSAVADRDVQAPPDQVVKITRDTLGGLREVTLVNHNTPAVLRIWGANSYCGKKELLHETPVVTHERWLKVDLKLEPKGTYSYIILESFFKTPLLFPYNGNILLDNLSPIKLVPCVLPEPLVNITSKAKNETTIRDYTLTADVKNVKSKYDIVVVINGNLVENFSYDEKSGKLSAQTKLKNGKNTFKIRATNESGTAEGTSVTTFKKEEVVAVVPPREEIPREYNNTTPKPKPAPPKPKITTGLDRSKLAKGKTVQINKMYFDMNSYEINEGSKPALEEVYNFLINNDDIVVEIGGHTNDRCDSSYCNELSENRAKAVVDYLISKGIGNNRLSYKGYGKTKQVATNRTAEGRKKNQRVEIKILSIG